VPSSPRPILSWIDDWRATRANPPQSPLEALEAAEAHRKFHQYGTATVLLVGAILAAAVWLIPTLFHDPTEARVITLAFITGPLAIALSIPVMARLRQEEETRVEGIEKSRTELTSKEEEAQEAVRKRFEEWLEENVVALRKDDPGPGLPREFRPVIDPAVFGILGEEEPTEPSAADRLVLSWVDLRNADLRGQNFRGALLRGADLRGATLDSADLRGADLGDSRLEGASLHRVRYDINTIWPASIDRRALETMSPEETSEEEPDA
jgi:hypothetical protein